MLAKKISEVQKTNIELSSSYVQDSSLTSAVGSPVIRESTLEYTSANETEGTPAHLIAAEEDFGKRWEFQNRADGDKPSPFNAIVEDKHEDEGTFSCPPQQQKQD